MTSQEQVPHGRSAELTAGQEFEPPVDRDIVIVGAEDSFVVDDLDDDAVSTEWHEIQAMFVDDPRGSVVQAAAAADAAVYALMATLQQRQAALRPASTAGHDSPGHDSPGHDPTQTEQLREALRSYRVFCQHVAHLGQQLSEPATISS